MVEENNEDFASELECPLCLDVLNDPFMYSKCGHNVCKSCCEQIHQLQEPLLHNKIQQNTKTIKCPVCRTQNKISDIVYNRTLSNITKTLLKKKNTSSASMSTSSSTNNLDSKIIPNEKAILPPPESSSTTLPQGKVEVAIIEAKDLNPTTNDGSCDPFVEVLVNGNLVQKTKTVQHTVNPLWNEKFEVNLNPRTDRIYFRIFHDGKDRILLGEFGIPVHHLPFNESVSLDVPLYSSNTKGVLYIQVRALNYGVDPKSIGQETHSVTVPQREDVERSKQSTEEDATLTGSQVGDIMLGVGAVAAGVLGVGALALGSVAAVKTAQRRNSRKQDPECRIM